MGYQEAEELIEKMQKKLTKALNINGELRRMARPCKKQEEV